MLLLRNPFLKYCALKLEKWAYKNAECIIGLSPQMCKAIKKLSGKIITLIEEKVAKLQN